MFYAMAGFSILGPFLVASIPFVFENTATHVVLRFFLPSQLFGNQVIFTVFTSAYWAFNMFSIIVHPNQMVLGMIVIFLDSSHYLKPAYVQGLNGIQNLRRTTGRPNIRRASVVYNTTAILWRVLMQFGVAFIPMLIFITVIVLPVCIFATIKHQNELPVYLMAGFVSVGVMVLLSLVFICNLVKIIQTEESDIRGFWSNEILSQNGKQILASLLPIRVDIGHFCVYQSDTFLIILAKIVDMTVTMMVA